MVLPTNVTELADQDTPLDRIRVEPNEAGTAMRASIVFDLGFGHRQDHEIHDVSQLLLVPGHQPDKVAQVEELRAECRTLRENLKQSELRLGHVEISLVQAERALQQTIETQERLAKDNKRLRQRIADIS